MYRFLLLSAIGLHFASALAGEPGAPAQPEPISAAAFFGHSDLHGATLSPDGRMLALITQPKGKRRGIVLLDLTTMQRRELARYEAGDVGNVRWLNDSRLTFTVINLPEKMLSTSSGLYAVNVDGSWLKGLSPTVPSVHSFTSDGYAAEGSGGGAFFGMRANRTVNTFLVVSYPTRKLPGYLNSRDLELEYIDVPLGSHTWGTDENDEVRVALTTQGDETVLYHRPGMMWKKITSFKKRSEQAFTPVMYSSKGLYVLANNGQDKTAMYRYDLARAAFSAQPLLASPEYDMDVSIVTDDTGIAGLHTHFGSNDTIWFDDTMKAVQREVDALLPGTGNDITRARRARTPFFLVQSASNTEPGITWIYNRETAKLHEIGRRKPELPASRMLPTRNEHYTTRDGRKLAVNITLPGNYVQGKTPAVILLPQMPWYRNTYPGWDTRVQFLASRGYAVIEPEARGTRGYGKAALEAGRRQWGLGMQDDIVDSARWAGARGYADPARICAAGQVYGGYAALMGVMRDPDVFRCAVSISGIVDLERMYAKAWKRSSEAIDDYTFAEMVGDPDADRDQFAATSPLKQASRITRPVFLAFGARDSFEAGGYAQQFYEAVKASSPRSELHAYDGPDSRSTPLENRIDLWSRIEVFLNQHIGSR